MSIPPEWNEPPLQIDHPSRVPAISRRRSGSTLAFDWQRVRPVPVELHHAGSK